MNCVFHLELLYIFYVFINPAILKSLICVTVSPSEAYSGPSDLQFSGETTNSLRFRWTSAGGPVSGYVVQYRPLSGLGQPITSELRQVRRMLIKRMLFCRINICKWDKNYLNDKT